MKVIYKSFHINLESIQVLSEYTRIQVLLFDNSYCGITQIILVNQFFFILVSYLLLLIHTQKALIFHDTKSNEESWVGQLV